MPNNLLTEVSRISEIIYGTTKSLLNEGVIGNVFKEIAEAEIQKIIRAEIKTAIRAGAKDANVAARNSAKNIESSVLKKTGLNSLTGPQKSALKVEAATIAKEETEAAAKITTSKGAKAVTSTAEKEAAVTATQNINKNFNKNTVEVVVKLEGTLPGIKNASKTGSKTVKTSTGRTKNLKRPALSEKQVLELDTAVRNGATEQIITETRRGFKSWANWVKWGKRIGIGAGVLWLLWYFMSDDATPVPDDITPTPTPPSPNPESSNYRDCNSVEFLSQGCKSEKIKDLQTCIGLTGRDVDGLWGPKTQAKMVELGLATGILVSDIEGICNSYNQIKTGSNADLESSREKLQNRQQNRTFSGEEGPYADYDAASTSSPSTQPSGTNSTEGPTAEY
jgi:hypothetical protein